MMAGLKDWLRKVMGRGKGKRGDGLRSNRGKRGTEDDGGSEGVVKGQGR
jgi:hypothetical protein